MSTCMTVYLRTSAALQDTRVSYLLMYDFSRKNIPVSVAIDCMVWKLTVKSVTARCVSLNLLKKFAIKLTCSYLYVLQF